MDSLLDRIKTHQKWIILGIVLGTVLGLLLSRANFLANLTGDITSGKKTTPTISEVNVPATQPEFAEQMVVPKLIPPSIKVQSPNGGQIFIVGDQTKIYWEMASGYKANLYLITMKDNVVQKEVIAGKLLPSDSPYAWTVPDKNGPYWIQAELLDKDGKPILADTSDRYFVIRQKPVVKAEDNNKVPGLRTSDSGLIGKETVNLTPSKKMDANEFAKIETTLNAMPEVFPVGKMTAEVVGGSSVTSAYPGDQILMATYKLKATGENFTVQTISVVNDTTQGAFRMAMSTSAVKRVVLADENDGLISMANFKDNYASFADLHVAVPENAETVIKLYAILDPTAAAAGQDFRLGIRNLMAVGQLSNGNVTLNSGQEITGSERIQSVHTSGGKLDITWNGNTTGQLKYGVNEITSFTLSSSGVAEADVTGMKFDVQSDATGGNTGVKEYRLKCDGNELTSAQGDFALSLTLMPKATMNCDLSADVRGLGADTVTLSIKLADLSGNFLTKDLIANAPAVDLTHSCSPIIFADPYLEGKVRKAVNKESDNLTRDDVETLTVLDASGKYEDGAADISGIECLQNLQELSLNNTTGGTTKIKDIASLDMLTSLKKLDLRGNEVDDISALAGLTAMERLLIDGNKVSDLSPVAGMDNLTKLTAGAMAVADISALANMSQLTELDLSNNQITDVSPLKGLTNLTSLDLEKNQIASLTPLAQLTALGTLNLAENRITDISALKNMSALTDLNLNQNQVVSLEPLSSLTKLQTLLLYGNAVKDITPLAGLTQLTNVTLYQNASLYNGPRNCETLNTLLDRKVKMEYNLDCPNQ